MKLSVIDWARVQNECFTDDERSTTYRDDEHRVLFSIIEDRTFGKRWSHEVAIGLRPEYARLAQTCLDRADERHRQKLAAECLGDPKPATITVIDEVRLDYVSRTPDGIEIGGRVVRSHQEPVKEHDDA